MKYRTIVADPPWAFSGGDVFKMRRTDGEWAASVIPTYAQMSNEEIASLPVKAQVADDAHLYLWTLNSCIVPAHDIARAWGFEPKTILTWTKTYQDDLSRVSCKTGYYFRGATEHCLFCVRGSLKLQTSDALPTGYLWPRLPHSVKPDAFYDLVEKASPGPYLELFARRARLGDWHYWGDQSLGTAEMAA